jgi:spermidine synthase
MENVDQLFKGTCIKRIESADHPIEVWENKHKRWLTFGSINIQSSMDLSDPARVSLEYAKVLIRTLMFEPAPKRILVLGLGGGVLVRYFLKHFPDVEITAVELNPDVVAVARDYFELDVHAPNLSIVVDDASHFVQQTKAQYDIIFMDVFSANAIPLSCRSFKFFQNVHRCLSPQGTLAVNALFFSTRELAQTVATIRRVFNNQTLVSPLSEIINTIVFAVKGRQIAPLVDAYAHEYPVTSLEVDHQLGFVAETRGV